MGFSAVDAKATKANRTMSFMVGFECVQARGRGVSIEKASIQGAMKVNWKMYMLYFQIGLVKRDINTAINWKWASWPGSTGAGKMWDKCGACWLLL